MGTGRGSSTWAHYNVFCEPVTADFDWNEYEKLPALAAGSFQAEDFEKLVPI